MNFLKIDQLNSVLKFTKTVKKACVEKFLTKKLF